MWEEELQCSYNLQMNDWDEFTKGCIFARTYEPVRAEGQMSAESVFQPNPAFEQLYPRLTKLLKKARLTRLQTARGERHLLGWTDVTGRFIGWLVFPPGYEGSYKASSDLHSDHKLLLNYFGGVDETSYAPELEQAIPDFGCDSQWTLNLNFWLGERDCELGIDSWDVYFEMLQEFFENPIDPNDFITFAVEANGNSSAYNKRDGTLILFAHDHAFSYVSPYPGCPSGLYTFNNCAKFSDWIETVAGQWSELIS